MDYFIKLNLLICGLVLSVSIIIFLKKHGFPEDVESFFNSGVISAKSFCPTRVASLNHFEDFKIFQRSNKWILERQKGDSEELHFLTVEKWLSQFCQIKFQPLAIERQTSFKPLLKVEFVTGSVKILQKSDQNIYKWSEFIFESNELDQSLRQLHVIAKNFEF